MRPATISLARNAALRHELRPFHNVMWIQPKSTSFPHSCPFCEGRTYPRRPNGRSRGRNGSQSPGFRVGASRTWFLKTVNTSGAFRKSCIGELCCGRCGPLCELRSANCLDCVVILTGDFLGTTYLTTNSVDEPQRKAELVLAGRQERECEPPIGTQAPGQRQL